MTMRGDLGLLSAAVALSLLTAPAQADQEMSRELDEAGVLREAGVERSLFVASDCLLDVRGRQLIEQVAKSDGAAQDVAALRAIADLKRFTLVHADVAIQHHFTADVLRGLDRTLVYAGKAGDEAEIAGRIQSLSDGHKSIEAALGQLGVQFEGVFPLVAAPPRNRIKDQSHDRAYHDKRYAGSRDFVAVTGGMLERAGNLLAESKSIERDARTFLAELGASGGSDWGPDSPLRT